MSIPVVPNLIPYVIMYKVCCYSVRLKAVVVLVKL